MLKGVLLAAATLNFEDVITSWQQAGFFKIILPFLLIFALVFGILTRIKIFKENKIINAIIAAVVALMSIQVSIVSDFFSAIVPRLGIGLMVVLVILILAGFFADPDSNVVNYVLIGIGIITAIVVLIQAAGSLGWSSGQWWSANWPVIAGAIFILLLVIVIVAGTSTPQPGKEPHKFRGYWARHEDEGHH